MAVPMSKVIIGTRPGERPFKMKLDPPDRVYLPWTGKPCPTFILLTNTSRETQLFKIKCTDNVIFRVQPPFGFLEPGEKLSIKVIQNAKIRPEENKHYIQFMHVPVTPEEAAAGAAKPAKAWVSDARADGTTRIQAHFEEPKTKTLHAKLIKEASISVEDKQSGARKKGSKMMPPTNDEAKMSADEKKGGVRKKSSTSSQYVEEAPSKMSTEDKKPTARKKSSKAVPQTDEDAPSKQMSTEDKKTGARKKDSLMKSVHGDPPSMMSTEIDNKPAQRKKSMYGTPKTSTEDKPKKASKKKIGGVRKKSSNNSKETTSKEDEDKTT